MKILKYIKPIIWAIGFSLFSANNIAATVVSFNISDKDIQINETFFVDVLVSGVDPFDEVLTFGFDLDLDPTWSLSSVTIGSDFDFDDSAIFPNTDVAGSVDFLNAGPNGDNIVLASLELSASNSGVYNLGIISDLFDPNEGLYLSSSFDALDLTYTEQMTIHAPVPVPGAIWLFGSALVAFLKFRRIS